MNKQRLPVMLLLVAAAASAVLYLLWPHAESLLAWESRKVGFQEAARRAEPLLEAIRAYSAANGQPPQALAELLPTYLQEIPATGLDRCERFEYRVLPNSQTFVVWYDLGSRHGQPFTGRSRYRDGDPDHAILVFTLDSEEKITSALIDRAPEDVQPVDFHSRHWKAGRNRMQMAPALADTYRLYGMPRVVFEELLGLVDGSRLVQRAPWELRINCPIGLFNHNALVYWPTEHYPGHLYGGKTEPVDSWVYIRD